MKTALKTIKGLGTAHNGVGHWWLQRVTAVALIPLVLWFVITLLCFVNNDKPIVMIFANQLSIVIFFTLLIISLLHSTLGVKVIIEDYIHSEKMKVFTLLLIKLLAWFTTVLLLFAVIHLYIVSLNSL